MRRIRLFAPAALFCAGLLSACFTSGPQSALNGMADAMQAHDSAAFLAYVDMKAFAANAIKSLTREDKALSTLDRLGRTLGLGGMEDLLGSVMDMERDLTERFTRGVSTGELEAGCRRAETPDCPWVPQALRHAQVTELDSVAAVARVTTPARMSSWLALRKEGERWRVVGHAALEGAAREYAQRRDIPPPPRPKAPARREGVSEI